VLLTACAARLPEDPAAAGITVAQLLAAGPLIARIGDPPPVPDADMLGPDPAMRRFVAANVDRNLPPGRRLDQLMTALIADRRLVVMYDDSTRTAAEVFRRREANCLSFAGMVVALAREAGIAASYQEVDVPPDWTQHGDTLVLGRHVNVLVRGGRDADRVVDFNMADFDVAYPRRPISDARARAHFYSNLGAEQLQSGHARQALGYFRKALAEDAGFAAAWVNLGALYQRAEAGDWARAAWRQALVVDPGELAAASNLERQYREEGKLAAADVLRGRIARYRDQNPYYSFYLAQRAFGRGDYREAVRSLELALRRKPAEDRFMALLGLSYLKLGDIQSATRWLAAAEAAAATGGQSGRYEGKLEMLPRSGAG